MKYLLAWPLANIRHNRWTSVASVAGIGLAAFGLTTLLGFVGGYERAVARDVEKPAMSSSGLASEQPTAAPADPGAPTASSATPPATTTAADRPREAQTSVSPDMRHSLDCPMLRAASVLSLALVLVAPGLASAKQLTIKLKDPPLDTAVRASEELVLTLGIDVLMDGTLLGTMEAARTESTRKIESILHWDDEKRHVLVTVDSISERETTRSPSGNEDSAVESPLNGKSYFAEWTAARGLAFTSGSGGTLTKEESAALAELYDDLGSRQNRMGAALTGRRLTVGEPVELPPDAVAALLGGGDDFVIEEISLTLEGKVRVDGKPCAKFATEMVLSNDDGGMKMIIRLAGSFVIRLKDGMTLSFNFEGPLSATGTSNEPGSPPVQMNGGGTMKVSATYTEL